MSLPILTRCSPGRPLRIWFLALGMTVVVAIAYWSSYGAPFLFDDADAVVNNATIRHLWTALLPPVDGSATTGRPLLNFSYALNYAMSGDAVWSYHLLNVIIHMLAALALMGLVRRTLEKWNRMGARGFGLSMAGATKRVGFFTDRSELVCWIAFFSALLWALHPLQTESVICIAQRTESLCGLFYLLTLYGFVRSVEDRMGEVLPGSENEQSEISASGRRWRAFSVLACLAGMATKEVMVTAPVVALLYDRTFLSGDFATAWRRHRKHHLAFMATWALLVFLLIVGGGSRGVAAGFGLGVSVGSYLLTQCQALVLYLKLSFWPHPLVLDYGNGVVSSITEVWWQGVVVLSLLAATGWALVRRPVIGFFGAWFFLILAPSSSVVPLVTQTMAEHRMYLPLAGILIPLVVVVFRFCGGKAVGLLTMIAFLMIVVTGIRAHQYRDTLTIWSATVMDFPRSARAHNNLALVLQEHGESALASAHFSRAVSLQPNYASAHYNWGVMLLGQGEFSQAIAEFEATLRWVPLHADAQLNLGNALMHERRVTEAIEHYEKALAVKPAADIHYNLGVALIEAGRFTEARRHLEAALGLDANLPEAHYQLGRLAEKEGDTEQALHQYADVLLLSPNHIGAHRRLGFLSARAGRNDVAIDHFRAIIRLRPEDAEAIASLGNVLLLEGRVSEAIQYYDAALRIRPNDTRIRENLQMAHEALAAPSP